jgi:CO/xanthine dehydrogenase FAD-binding subunit
VKPSSFAYQAPHSLEDALALIGEDARPLAGGQSLVPMMNFRLANPAVLVDLNGVTELGYTRAGAGGIRIGAMTRQSAAIDRGWSLLAQAARCVGHRAIRARGTIGGSIAHADPAAEFPAALLALGASYRVASVRGERLVPAASFAVGPFQTVLEPDELLIAIELPPFPVGARTAFLEHARTHGDFATAAVGVLLTPEVCAISLVGAGSVPVRAGAAERAVLDGASDLEAAELAGALVPDEYRSALITELVRRALAEAR